MVREGKIQLGDKYWQYTKRIWLPVLSKQSFLGENAATSMGIFIRKVE
jgi:hypothetical protein